LRRGCRRLDGLISISCGLQVMIISGTVSTRGDVEGIRIG